MKTDKNIFIAFILNLFFSIFEFVGGIITNSVAITSDAIHDLGDTISIGLSAVLEHKSKKEPNEKYTYGYVRYSILGAFITSMILCIGSIFVIYNALIRIINPQEINYNGMILIALIGFIVNLIAAFFTKAGHSLNEKAINLHMLEDVLGWLIVLVGSFLIKFTKINIIDSIMSLLVAIFIFTNAIKNIKEVLDLFLEKTPKNINVDDLKKHILKIKGIENIHHLHIWSMDGVNNFATMHLVCKNDKKLKEKVREEMKEFGISHTTIEIEDEICDEENCKISVVENTHHHHHH